MPRSRRRRQNPGRNPHARPMTGPAANQNPLRLIQRADRRVELPRTAFEKILPQLPRVLRTQYAKPIDSLNPDHLVQRYDDRVKFLTRDAASIAMLLSRAGIPAIGEHHISDERLLRAELPPQAAPSVLSNVIITRMRYGQIVANNNSMRWEIIREILCSYRAPFLLVVASQEDAKQAVAELESRLEEPVQLAQGLKAANQVRVIVCTYQAFRSMDLAASGLIIPYIRRNFTRWMKDVISSPFADRIYAFRTPDQPLSQHDADEITAWLGSHVLDLPNALRQNPIFSIVRFGGGNLSAKPQPAMLNKRGMYWRHDMRNYLLASIAVKMAEANPLLVQHDGRTIVVNNKCHADAELSTEAAKTQQIAVLVENREHAQRLARILPGWAVIDRTTDVNVVPRKYILTLTAAAAHTEICPAVLINAMGGPPSSWVADYVNKQARVGRLIRVIDVTDQHAEQANKYATARRKSYREYSAHLRPLQNAMIKNIWKYVRELQIADSKGGVKPR